MEIERKKKANEVKRAKDCPVRVTYSQHLERRDEFPEVRDVVGPGHRLVAVRQVLVLK